MALKYSGTTLTSTTATFIGERGQRFALQPDVAVYVAIGGSSIVASSTNGVLVAAGGLYEDMVEGDGSNYVSVAAVSGSHNTKLFRGART